MAKRKARERAAPPAVSQVDVQRERGLRAPEARRMRQWVLASLKHEGRDGTVCVRIVDGAESQALNTRYRGIARPTNVLAFPAELPDVPLASRPLGDVVICAPLVAAEAHNRGKAPEAHWAHLTVHGVLHLLGYDHRSRAEARVMEAHEIEILAGLGFGNPYELPAETQPLEQ